MMGEYMDLSEQLKRMNKEMAAIYEKMQGWRVLRSNSRVISCTLCSLVICSRGSRYGERAVAHLRISHPVELAERKLMGKSTTPVVMYEWEGVSNGHYSKAQEGFYQEAYRSHRWEQGDLSYSPLGSRGQSHW